jgi:hypothetical protein
VTLWNPDIGGRKAKRKLDTACSVGRNELFSERVQLPRRLRADDPKHTGSRASQAHGCLCLRSPDLRFALRPSQFTSSENPPNLAALSH